MPWYFRGLYSTPRFRDALERERARADRWELPLSLLSLGAKPGNTGRRTLSQAGKILHWRLRRTDEAGWLDHYHLGILMPNTPSWGAWTLADDICAQFPEDIPLPDCRVYCYPSEWFREKDPWSGARGESPEEDRRVDTLEPLLMQATPWWKRALDIIGASVGLVVTFPLMMFAVAGIKLTSPGPVLFAQQRVGIGGRPFTLYKFRTMWVDAERHLDRLIGLNEVDGPVFKIAKDPRVTPIGRFLRKSSLDELPQLWNVLVGDMSLVGPRPPIQREVVRYELWQRRRLDVTPGVTCIWQVHGRGQVSFADWVRMDLRYIASRSFWSDVKLLLQTLPAVLSTRGAT